MPYYLGLAYSPAKPLITKMGHSTLDDGTTLGVPIQVYWTKEELENAIKLILEDIRKNNREID